MILLAYIGLIVVFALILAALVWASGGIEFDYEETEE